MSYPDFRLSRRRLYRVGLVGCDGWSHKARGTPWAVLLLPFARAPGFPAYGENHVVATGATRDEARFNACREAESLGMMRRGGKGERRVSGTGSKPLSDSDGPGRRGAS